MSRQAAEIGKTICTLGCLEVGRANRRAAPSRVFARTPQTLPLGNAAANFSAITPLRESRTGRSGEGETAIQIHTSKLRTPPLQSLPRPALAAGREGERKLHDLLEGAFKEKRYELCTAGYFRIAPSSPLLLAGSATLVVPRVPSRVKFRVVPRVPSRVKFRVVPRVPSRENFHENGFQQGLARRQLEDAAKREFQFKTVLTS